MAVMQDPDSFGNYALKSFAGLEQPPAIDYFVLAPGAWALLLALVFGFSYFAWRRYQHWLQDAYRREALQYLQSQISVVELPRLLKATALQAYSRQQVAMLTGEAWLAFLDSKMTRASTRFQSEEGRLLLNVAYCGADEVSASQAAVLQSLVRAWIAGHRRDV